MTCATAAAVISVREPKWSLLLLAASKTRHFAKSMSVTRRITNPAMNKNREGTTHTTVPAEAGTVAAAMDAGSTGSMGAAAAAAAAAKEEDRETCGSRCDEDKKGVCSSSSGWKGSNSNSPTAYRPSHVSDAAGEATGRSRALPRALGRRQPLRRVRTQRGRQ